MLSLTIDIGNTDTCIGIWEDSSLIKNARYNSNDDEYEVLNKFSEFDIKYCIISSVVDNLLDKYVTSVRHIFKIEPLICNENIVEDLINIDISNPTCVGSDRLADCIGAKFLYGLPAIIVDFGTATNIEYVDEQGTFKGGILMPGLESGMKGLSINASKIFNIKLQKPSQLIGNNTEKALLSGLVYGEAARVDGLIARILEQENLNKSKVFICATGGFSSLVANYSKYINYVDSELTLKGLKVILNRVTRKN